MSKPPFEANDGTTAFLADGEAALWLSESLILALLEAKVLDIEAVLEAIDVVIAAKDAEAEEGALAKFIVRQRGGWHR